MIRSNSTSASSFGAGTVRRTRAVTRVGLAVATVLLVASASLLAAGEPQRKPDLGDTAEGVYNGGVISDARGSSKEGVTMTVTRIGVNRIEVASDYPRIPRVTYKLQRAMNTIQNVGGTDVFLLELSKSPRELHVTTDDAAWAGVKANGSRR